MELVGGGTGGGGVVVVVVVVVITVSCMVFLPSGEYQACIGAGNVAMWP